MSDKIKNQDIEADKGMQQEQAVEGCYEVEEQLFLRQHYDSTSMFEMDIEKAKQVAATHSRVLESGLGGVSSSPVNAALSEQETRDIKRTLAGLRELEQQQESEDSQNDVGLLGRLKRLFSNKS